MRNPGSERLNLDQIRARLATARGATYWRSLEEVAETEEFQDYLRHEFPAQADTWIDPVGRRAFLKLMGASFALAGIGACARQPLEQIVPYVDAPEGIVPGRPLMFASAVALRGFGLGVLVESHMGRPTKIEGNPSHPTSLGATDVFAQASILSLYDPDRSQAVAQAGRISTWEAFLDALAPALAEQRARSGAGLRILTETVTSPTLHAQLQALLAQYPEAEWLQYEPAGRDSVRRAARQAFGAALEVRYRFDVADVIVALDADFLYAEPGSVRYAREFAARRRVRSGDSAATMSRLYAVESVPTVTGSMADHRLALRAAEVAGFARELAQALGVLPQGSGAAPGAERRRWIDAIARDLAGRRGAGVVVAGDQQPAEVHLLAHAINHQLGNLGRTVILTEPVEARPALQLEELRRLAGDMQAGRVELLVILGGNPVYTAPADLRFSDRLAKVPLRVRLGEYYDETSEYCHWHIPQCHTLESWGDVRAHDGTVSIQQPLIAPLYGAKSVHEVLAALAGQPERGAHAIVKDHWRGRRPELADFERFWNASLHEGVIEGTAAAEVSAALRPGWADSLAAAPAPETGAGGEVEVVFRPDPTLWDGRFANNGWLQELPKPITKLTWDNAALLSPRTAQRLGVASGDVVALRAAGRAVRAPVWIVPGAADDSVTVHLGYGRRRAGRVGAGAGFNAFALQRSGAALFDRVTIARTGARHALATTQQHQSMEGRNLVRVGTLQQYLEDPAFAQHLEHGAGPEQSLYPEVHYQGYSWGMAIDLNACIGCNACTIACQAENNIPIVGKDQVARGRELHWIRVDRYFEGELDAPSVVHQPVPCMHCDHAPCELVCPVAATVHSDEGLNEMIYNRCIGTRYCSNNCPYKVRRFNFFQYSDLKTPSLRMLYNPDVTVRTRGVMEKCSYCVQRISEARISAEREGRSIRDGEVVTACQQVCPAEAIVFGDLGDPSSRVARLKAEPRDYALLAELNTRPRTTYQARLRNPNPELQGGAPAPEQGHG